MTRLLFSAVFLVFCSFAHSATSAAYVVTPGAGAVFSSTAGIVPQAVPMIFAATAANDAVSASRSIPFSVNTPHGVASGTVNTAGLISKPVAASLGKSLMRLNVPLQIGLALYDAYQAAGMTVDANGNVSASAPSGYFYGSGTDGSVHYLTAQAFLDFMNTKSTYVSPYQLKLDSPSANGNVNLSYLNYNWGTVTTAVYVSGAPVSAPATLAQKDTAIDSFANASASNAVRLAWEAYAAKVTYPNLSIIGLQSPSVSVLSPWAETATAIDSLGNVTKTLTRTEVVVSPDPAAMFDSAIPVKIIEHTQTQVNASPSGSSSKVVSSAAPGVSADSALSASAIPPPVQTDCDKNPDSIGCSQFGEADIPDFELPGKNVPLTFAPTALGGVGACPAPKTFTYFGKVYSLPYTPLCAMVTTMRPLVILLSSLAAAYIFVGGLRNG